MKLGKAISNFFENALPGDYFKSIMMTVVDLEGDKTTFQEKSILPYDFKIWLRKKLKPSEYIDDDKDKGILVNLSYSVNDSPFFVSYTSKDLETLSVTSFKFGDDEISKEKYQGIKNAERLADFIVDFSARISKEKQIPSK